MSRRREKLYHIYYGMKARCYNKNNPKYAIYGGKGIRICDEWNNNYESFKRWALNNGYYESNEPRHLSIDRIDSDLGYSPENCRWITFSENSGRANINRKKFNGHRSGKIYAYNSKTNTTEEITNITQFAKLHSLCPSTICHKINGRVKNKWYKQWKFYRTTEGVTAIENTNI